MWRKSVLLQFLLASLLLAGAVEARQAGSNGSQIGKLASRPVAAGTIDVLRPLANLSAAWSEGEAGSIINPDGVRALGIAPPGAGYRGKWKIRVAFDPHG